MDVYDFLVVGAGIAGLSAAIRLADAGSVLCVTKEALAESNTAYAQGGIAVAMGGEHDVALHLEDTLAAGDGLVDRGAAAVLVEQGPERVAELLGWGTEFDRDAKGELERTREGAHSLSRILHAHGDGTGAEIARALRVHAQTLKNISLAEWTMTVDLEKQDGRVVGALLTDREGALRQVRAGAVLIASGGAGQVYSDTTNPAVATGDGIAMAYRAGAELEDMEFYQFHPTAFAQEGAPRFLLSEALRGEGAFLLNAQLERFMPKLHPQKELAPRDIVARAIAREGLAGPVYLDMRHVSGVDLVHRFPGISAFLANYGLLLSRDLIPVRPAAHYLMGGIRTDEAGRTSLPGLYAAGEAACTGVHGANRLASNSLLEGLVFGFRAANAMVKEGAAVDPSWARPVVPLVPRSQDAAETDRWRRELQTMMWLDAGLLRDAAGLQRAEAALAELQTRLPVGLTHSTVEARNLYTVALVIVQAALGRCESRGAHFRNDYPGKDPVAKHSIMVDGKLHFAA